MNTLSPDTYPTWEGDNHESGQTDQHENHLPAVQTADQRQTQVGMRGDEIDDPGAQDQGESRPQYETNLHERDGARQALRWEIVR